MLGGRGEGEGTEAELVAEEVLPLAGGHGGLRVGAVHEAHEPTVPLPRPLLLRVRPRGHPPPPPPSPPERPGARSNPDASFRPPEGVGMWQPSAARPGGGDANPRSDFCEKGSIFEGGSVAAAGDGLLCGGWAARDSGGLVLWGGALERVGRGMGMILTEATAPCCPNSRTSISSVAEGPGPGVGGCRGCWGSSGPEAPLRPWVPLAVDVTQHHSENLRGVDEDGFWGIKQDEKSIDQSTDQSI